ncbi:MAG: JAB domain-containing protein [Eubacteriales bacterium]|nr:JAB domain-containing protein [Eubacteriales bacterium]
MGNEKTIVSHHHEGHRSRMRNKLAKNIEHTLEDHELIEMLLYYIYPRCDTNEKAHRIFSYFGGKLNNLLDADRQQLLDAGLTDVGASFFELFRELVRSYKLNNINDRFSFTDTQSLMDYCISLVDSNQNEQFYIICFDAKNRRINDIYVAKGSAGNVGLSMRAVVDASVKNRASSVVMMHNHPNGILTASAEDIATTHKIDRALRMLGISLADHIIVAGGKAVSMRESGCFDIRME